MATPEDGKDAQLVSDSVEPLNLLPLWEHALADVFAHGDGKQQRALLLTFAREGIAEGDDGQRQCVDDNETIGGLECPYIQPVLEIRRVDSGRLVLAYELVQGTSLGQHIFDGPMAPERVIAILRQLCRAFDAAHGEGIRHGALSVSSVLLTEDETGRKDAVRLVDFGLHHGLTAKAMGEHEIELQPLSPEKVRGEAPDAREDIYLLGAIGYAALAGRPLFTGKAEEIRRGHKERSADLLDVDAPLAAVIMRCLEKDPAKRFADVRQIDDALMEAQGLSGLFTDWEDLPAMAKASASLSSGRMIIELQGKRIPKGGIAALMGKASGGNDKIATSKPAPKVQPKAKAIPRSASKPEPKAKPVSKPEPKAKSISKPEPKAKSVSKPAPKARSVSKPEPKAKSDAVPEEALALDTSSLIIDSETSSPPPLPAGHKTNKKVVSNSETSGTRRAPPKGGVVPPPPATSKDRKNRASALGLNLGRARRASGKHSLGPKKEVSGPKPKADTAAKTDTAAKQDATAKPESATKTDSAKLDATAKPQPATKPDSAKPDSAKPDAAKPDTAKPDAATKPDAKGSEASGKQAPALDEELATTPVGDVIEVLRAESKRLALTAEAAAAGTGAATKQSKDEAGPSGDEATSAASAPAVDEDEQTAVNDVLDADELRAESATEDASPPVSDDADEEAPTAVNESLDKDELQAENEAEAPVTVQPPPATEEESERKFPLWLAAVGLLLLIAVPIALMSGDDDEAPETATNTKTAPAKTAPTAPEPPTPPPTASEGVPSADSAATAPGSGGEADSATSATSGDDVAGADPASSGDDSAADDGAEPPAADDGAEPPAADDGSSDEPAVAKTPKQKAQDLTRAGNRAYSSGQSGKAESKYKSALATYSRAHAAAAGLGKIAFNKSDYGKAAKYYGKAVKIAGSNSGYRIRYGDSLYKQGKYSEAKKQYAKAKSLGNPQAAGRLKKVAGKTG